MATNTTQTSNKKVAIEYSLVVGAKKNKVERVAPSAKIKLEEVTGRVFYHNLSNGDYEKIFDNLNNSLSNLREEIKEKEEETAEKEAKFDEKVNGEGINELNQNLLFQKLLKTISRSTEPSKVVRILDNKKMVLVDDRYENYVQSVKARPIMVAAILKEVMSTIGSKPKLYSKIEEKEEVKEEEPEEVEVKDSEEARNLRLKKIQNFKFKRFFKDIKSDEIITEIPRTKKIQELKNQPGGKIVSDGEVRRRRIIGDAGTEIEEIEKLESSVGENEQFNRALINRKNKLKDMVKKVGKMNYADKELDELSPNTMIQDFIEEAIHYSEAPSKQEHDRMQKEFDEYYSDPYVQKQIEIQQLQGVLYDNNQPENYNKILENERKADRLLASQLIDEQEDSIKKINQDIINSKEAVVKEEKEKNESAQISEWAKSEALAFLLNNLVLQAVNEVSEKYKENLKTEIEEQKKMKREADALAVIIDFNNLASQAFDEIINSEKGRIANEKFSEKLKEMANSEAIAYSIQNLAAEDYEKMLTKLNEEYDQIKKEYQENINKKIEEDKKRVKREADAQAIIIDFNNNAHDALEEIIASEKKKIQDEEFKKQLTSWANAEANAFLYSNLAKDAHDETIASLKNKYIRELDEENERHREARMLGEKLFQQNLAADAVEQETKAFIEKNKDVIKKSKSNRAIKKGEIAVRKKQAELDGKKEAKRLLNIQQIKERHEGAAEEAQNLFIKDIKLNAELVAKKIINDSKEEVKETPVEEKKQVVVSTNKNGDYSVTDIDNRYLRVYDKSRKIQIDGKRYNNLENNSKSKYGIRDYNDDSMVESLMMQLEELGLGDDSSEEQYMKKVA